MRVAIPRVTGALKRSVMGRSGRHAACAFSRSQAKGSRTSKSKRCATRLATPGGVATPLAVHHLHASSGGQRAVAAQRGEARRFGTRGLVPPDRLEHRVAFGALDERDGDAFARAVGRAPDVLTQARGRGRAAEFEHEGLPLVDLPARRQSVRTDGPPVSKHDRSGALSAAPEAERKPATRSTVQRTPGGSSAAKSNTHRFAPVQRGVPLPACASSRRTVKGAGARGSPKSTAGSSNVATTCRTRATSPRGERSTSCSAWARGPASASSATVTTAMFFLLSMTSSLRREDQPKSVSGQAFSAWSAPL